MEYNIDRMGGDYANMELDLPDPSLCKAACENDDRCFACTYVKPGGTGREGAMLAQIDRSGCNPEHKLRELCQRQSEENHYACLRSA